jgi:hypothetical protein
LKTTADTFTEAIARAADATDDPLVSAWLAALAAGDHAARLEKALVHADLAIGD